MPKMQVRGVGVRETNEGGASSPVSRASVVVPETLAEWNLGVVRALVQSGLSESDRFEFKEMLNPEGKAAKEKFNSRIRTSACAFANSSGGFFVFGVSEEGRGEKRIVGIPFSRENAATLQAKLQGIEPSILLAAQDPPIPLEGERVILVAEIPRGRRGPHWDPSTRRFVRRGLGATIDMTMAEVRMAFIDQAERIGRIRLIFLSLIDNWIRLERIANQADGGPFVLPALETAAIKINLGEVQALQPDLVIPLFEILGELDAIEARCQYMRSHAEFSHKGRNEFLTDHRRDIRSSMDPLRQRIEWLLGQLQTAFGFKAVVDRMGRERPPLVP
jgi:hypothetical protein